LNEDTVSASEVEAALSEALAESESAAAAEAGED